MLPLATSAQMKELDRLAIEEQGVPSLELMERAAQAVADTVREVLQPDESMCSSSIGVIFMHKQDAPRPLGRNSARRTKFGTSSRAKTPTPPPGSPSSAALGTTAGTGWPAPAC